MVIKMSSRERFLRYRLKYEVQNSLIKYNGVENVDYVTCHMCGKRGLYIDSRHLRTRHNLTKSQYLLQFPAACLTSDKKAEAQSRPDNKSASGKKRTIESIIKLSLSKLGEKNPAWSGGKANGIYCCFWHDTEYKDYIKSLDNYTCQYPSCRRKDDLCIHHIDYNKKNCTPENLITLCRDDNSKVNANRKAWKKFFQQLKRYYT
jgi:hypothetical protein